MTSPVGMVLGEFDVIDIIEDSIPRLWNRTRELAGIGRESFFSYFYGRDTGYAIQIGQVRRYRVPLCITARFGMGPPQSFAYVHKPKNG